MDKEQPSNIQNFERLTGASKQLIKKSYDFAAKLNHEEFLAIHLLMNIFTTKTGIVSEILNRVSVDIQPTLNSLQKVLGDTKKKESEKDKTIFSKEIKEVINKAYEVAKELDQVHVGTEHLLLGMFKLKYLSFIQDFSKVGIDYTVLKKVLRSMGNYAMIDAGSSENGTPSPFGLPKMPFGDMGFGSEEPESFLTNMNEMAEDGIFSNITGRDKEIKRLIHILSRKTKNNPILVGDAGVGKTAIVEGFVNSIVSKNVPSSFFEKKVLSVDIAGIIAGAKLRGDVEERLQDIISYAVDEGNVILFIDEIHTIIGAGAVGSKDNLDIANMLKPHLTSSDLTVIGATTQDEYSKYFEGDAALNRRFQSIEVEELDKDSAKKVVKNLKEEFEDFHNVKIQENSIDTAVELSDQYIKYRYLPDKVIDIIDEACSSVKIGREIAIEPELSELGEKLIEVQNKKEVAVNSNNLSKAAKLKEEEEKIVDEIADVIEGKKKVRKKYRKVVTPELVKKIIVDWTGIPIAASDMNDKKRKSLDSDIKEQIIGQDHVVENVSMAIKRSHIGLTSTKRPLASFMFLGPTGVGKTELAKTLARELFGDEKLMYRVDMSEFMEMHSVAKLIGSPPGYVGHDEGGQLTKFVKRKPYSVILFDEIEKAHPDALNILLQVLEEGELEDSKGGKISFSNTIIVMTSNIGAEEVSNDQKLGFDIPSSDDEESDEMKEAYEEMKERIMEQLKNTLRPELINRIDLIDVFRGLNKKDTHRITKKEIDALKVQLVSKGIILDVDEKVVEFVNEEGYSKEYGGRNIRRKIQEIIENGLAEYLLNENIKKKKNEVLKVKVEKKREEVKFSVTV